MLDLKGIITPVVTPFNRDAEQSINYDALKELIESLLAKGVAGIFILGSNGEFHVVNDEETMEMAEKTVEIVAHRVPVFVGVGRNSTNETIKLIRKIEKTGADAVTVINPYFILPTEEEVISHYKTIASSTAMPIILYNIPKSTKYNIPPQAVRELAEIDNVIGIKDSSGNMDNLSGYLEAVKGTNTKVLIGSDSKISQAIRLGASGAIAGTSNVITETVVALYDTLVNGNERQAEQLQERIEKIRSVLKFGTVPSVMKRLVELKGINVGPARKPVGELDRQLDDQLIDVLKYYGYR